MNTMETELQRQDGELYAMYLRSMEIAERQWMPNIVPNKDSYNSYPHVKEVMRHIDRLLYEEECSFALNCSELYILLCAILMHDIGKGAPRSWRTKTVSGIMLLIRLRSFRPIGQRWGCRPRRWRRLSRTYAVFMTARTRWRWRNSTRSITLTCLSGRNR